MQALYYNTTGNGNTANGIGALLTNNTGENNTAIGQAALLNNTTGYYNSASGRSALYSNTIGHSNTANGTFSLQINTTGNYNTALGYNAFGTGTYSNSMALGANAYAITASNMITAGDANITYAGCKVGWTTISDARVKKDVKENVPGLVFIKQLRPVTYYYDRNKENELLGIKDTAYWEGKYDIDKIQFSGFLAQEVDAAAKKIGYDFSGVSKTSSLWGLKYAELTVPLVKAVQEQQEMIDSLKSGNALLKNFINQQDSINTTLKKQMDQLASIINTCCNTNSVQSTANTTQLQSSTNLTDVELSNKNVILLLQQNVPNPFSEQTTINYFIPDNISSAQIVFFEASGKIIKTVDLTEKGKGQLNVFASDLSNGTYTYSLIVDGQTIETKKMVRTK